MGPIARFIVAASCVLIAPGAVFSLESAPVRALQPGDLWCGRGGGPDACELIQSVRAKADGELVLSTRILMRIDAGEAEVGFEEHAWRDASGALCTRPGAATITIDADAPKTALLAQILAETLLVEISAVGSAWCARIVDVDASPRMIFEVDGAPAPPGYEVAGRLAQAATRETSAWRLRPFGAPPSDLASDEGAEESGAALDGGASAPGLLRGLGAR